MEEEVGYTDSQTWEAWIDSLQVFWDNTELIFLLSVIVSLGAVIYTCWQYPTANAYEPLEEEINSLNRNEGNNEEVNISDQSPYLGDEIAGSVNPNKPLLTQEIEERMSREEKEREQEARNEQLKVIYKLMQKQKEKFGDTSMEEIKDQMKFYC